MKPMHNNMRRNNRHRSGGGNNAGGGNHRGGNSFRPYSRNQMFDSNGPDGRTRGTAQQVYEKYLQQARDASASGDPVRAESLLQHAEHYFRILASFNEGQQGQPATQRYDQYGDEIEAQDGDGDQPNGGSGPQPAASNYPAPYSVYADNAGAQQPAGYDGQQQQNGQRQRWPRQQQQAPVTEENGQPAAQQNQNWGQSAAVAPRQENPRPEQQRTEPRNDPRRQRWEQQRQQAAPVQSDVSAELDDSLPAFLTGAPSILPVAPPMATNPVSAMAVALGEAPAESEATIAPDLPSYEANEVAAIAEGDAAEKPKRRGRPARSKTE